MPPSTRAKFDDGWGDDTIIDKAIADNNTDTANVLTFTSASTTPGTLTINLVSDSGPLPEVSDATGDAINVQDGPGSARVECGEGTDTVFFDATDTVIGCEIQNPS